MTGQSPSRRPLLRAECPQCRRVLPVQPPAGGNGAVDVFPRHDWPTAAGGSRCDYSRTEVRDEDYHGSHGGHGLGYAPEQIERIKAGGRRGDRDAIDDAAGLDPDPGAHTALSRALTAADTVDDATEERIAELGAEVQGDMARGEALRERMTALGLPIVDAARDVAGFERHCRGGGQATLGALATSARLQAPGLSTAIAAADTHGPVALNRDTAASLLNVLRSLAQLLDEAPRDDG